MIIKEIIPNPDITLIPHRGTYRVEEVEQTDDHGSNIQDISNKIPNIVSYGSS